MAVRSPTLHSSKAPTLGLWGVCLVTGSQRAECFLTPFVVWALGLYFLPKQHGPLPLIGHLGLVPGTTASTRGWGRVAPAAPAPPSGLAFQGLLVLVHLPQGRAPHPGRVRNACEYTAERTGDDPRSGSARSPVLSFPGKFFLCPKPLGVTGKVTVIDWGPGLWIVPWMWSLPCFPSSRTWLLLLLVGDPTLSPWSCSHLPHSGAALYHCPLPTGLSHTGFSHPPGCHLLGSMP